MTRPADGVGVYDFEMAEKPFCWAFSRKIDPTRMLSPHETFTKATRLILFLRTEDWLSRFYAARVIRVAPTGSKASPNVRYAFNGDRIDAAGANCREVPIADMPSACQIGERVEFK